MTIETVTSAIVTVPAIMLLMWSFSLFTMALGRRRLQVYVMPAPMLNSQEIDRMALIRALDDSIASIRGEALEDASIEYFDTIYGTVYAPQAPVQYMSYLECQAQVFYSREGLARTVSLRK